MGGCLSSPACPDLELQSTLMANVISSNGELRQYTVPINVSEVILNIIMEESQQGRKSSSFLCNSDSLYCNEYLRPMDTSEQLELGQVYFLLPASKFGKILTASDMAALAVKASIALNRIPVMSKSDHPRCQNRISPVLSESVRGLKKIDMECDESANSRERKFGNNSVGKISRLSYRRPKMTARLPTIYEHFLLH